MAKILIAGCGDIGLRLAKSLQGQGHCVVGLRRHPPVADNGSLSYCRADMTRPQELARLDHDIDQIFFMPAPDRRGVEAYRAVFQISLDNLLARLASQSAPPHWFFISSTSVYGQSQGEWVDEDSTAEPKTETGRIIRQAELTVLKEAPKSVIVRFSGLYGPGRDYLLKKTAQSPVIQLHPPYFTNRIHQDDCASVLAFLSARQLAGQALDNCYLASDDDPAPLWQVINWLAERLQCPGPVPDTGEGSLNQNKRCRNERLKALGYRFIHPSYRDGYLSMIGADHSP